MQPGIERRIVRVSLASGLSTALSIGTQLVSVPVCLRYWGKDTYGTWLSLFAAFTLMRTIDAGYIGYVGNKLNVLYHRDEEALRVTMSSAVLGTAILGVLQLIILTLLYATGSMGFIIGSQSHDASREAVLALFALSISWILSGSYLGIVHRLLIPVGLMYQATWWSMGFQLSQSAALVTAAVLGLGILETAVLFALVQVVFYAASALYIKGKLPRFYPWWSGPKKAIGVSDLLRSVPITLGGILQQAGNSGLVMLVASFLGPVVVPAFATVRTLSNLWVTLINVLTAPLLPDVVRFYAKREGRKLLAAHQAHWLLVASAVNLSIMIAYPFLETVYRLWTADRLSLDKSLLSLLLATVSLAGMSALMSVFLSGVNQSDFIVTCAALRGGLALSLGAFLLPAYGVTGLGFAIFLAEVLVLAITVRWFFRRELARIDGENIPSLFGWQWLSSVCTVLYLLIQGFDLDIANNVYWLALGGIIVGNLFAWRELDADIKQRVRCFLRSASRTQD